MAALLDIVHLRRHAPPAHFIAGLGRESDCCFASRSFPISGDRPRLTAIWRVGAACRCAVLLRRADRTMASCVCFLAACGILMGSRLLLRAGFLAPNDTALALRWPSGLARTGMRLWRRGRLCRRL
jgi:hypothetical protein